MRELKYWQKIFAVSFILVFVCLVVTGFLFINAQFEKSLDLEVTNLLNQHRTLCYALASSFSYLSTAASSDLSEATNDIIRWYGAFASAAALYDDDDDVIHASNMGVPFPEPGENTTTYYMDIYNGSRSLIISSPITTGVRLVTASVLEPLYVQRTDQVRNYSRTMMLITVGISVVLLILSHGFTRPIKTLITAANQMAQGAYDIQIRENLPNELGELSRSYNQLSRAIQEKISQLETTSEEKQRFIEYLTHEIRTPLTAIIGHAEYLRHYPSTASRESEESSALIYREARRIEALANRLMGWIVLKNHAFILQACSISSIARDVGKTVEPLLKDKNLTLHTDVEPADIAVDGVMIRSLFINLLNNAIEASYPGGDILLYGKIISGDQYETGIVDQGKGIPAKDLSYVTDAFYRVDKSRSSIKGNLGMGLTICDQIARIHHTRLSIRSTFGQGTTVSIILKISGGGDSDDDME